MSVEKLIKLADHFEKKMIKIASLLVVAKKAESAVIYGADWCVPCHRAQDYLKQRGVAVTFYDIVKEPEHKSEMQKKLLEGYRCSDKGIPVIDVGGQIFVGFRPKELDQALVSSTP